MRRISPARRGPFSTVVIAVVAVVLAGVVLALAAGCSGSSAGPPPPPTVHPGTAATSTSTPTSDPTAVAGAAAIAGVQKLYAELNRSLRTGVTVAYRRTFTAECDVCRTDARVTDGISARGEHIVGGGYTPSDLTVVLNQPRLIIVQGVLSEPALTVMKGHRVVARQSALPETSFTWKLVPVGPRWLVSSVQALR